MGWLKIVTKLLRAFTWWINLA